MIPPQHAIEVITTLMVAILSSAGLWSFISSRTSRRTKQEIMLKSIVSYIIVNKVRECVERGYITPDEYGDIYDDLYEGYKIMGGNGGIDMIMGELKKLPIRSHHA